MCVLGIYFAGCNREASIPLSVAALSFVGFGYAGCWIVSTDMSPTFAGKNSNVVEYLKVSLLLCECPISRT